MSQVAATGVTRPTIGDILLSHGFVDADTLAGAAEEQERTGQPLGQILVERGAITRLELASALAEQWAEAPAPRRQSTEPADTSSPAPSWGPPDDAQTVIDDDTYALRVQSAVTDLARRVGAAEPLLAELERFASTSVSPEALEASLAAIRGHVDASLERVDELESGLASVGTRLDQLTDGLDEAFGETQAVAVDLADRLASTAAAVAGAATLGDVETLRETLETRLSELAAGIAAESRQLSEARSMLTALAERPVLAPELEDRVEELAALLDGVARVGDISDVRTALDGLAERIAETADAAAFAALRRDLDELAAREDVPPELERRLDRLDARLSEAAGAELVAGLQNALSELGARIDDAADAASLAELRARFDATPATETTDTERLAGVEDLVVDLAARVESLGALAASGTDAAAIDELRSALEELGRRRHGDEETAARLESLSATVDELAARPAVDPALADRVAGLAKSLEAVVKDTTVADLRVAVDALAFRGGDVESALAELAERIEAVRSTVAAVPADDATRHLRAEVDALSERSGREESSLAELAEHIEELRSGLAAVQADEITQGLREEVGEIRLRLETDDASLAELRAAATELAARPAGDPELAARLTTVTTRVDDLTASVAATRDSTALEQLGLALASARTELAAALETVAGRVATLEDAPQPDAAASFAQLRDELAEQLREGLAGLTAEAPPGDVVWAAEAARLGERIDALAALVGDESVPVVVDAKGRPRREPTPVGPESDTERELERLRMAIERMAMHLGEQERALAEVMRSRGVAQRLDEIEARIDDLASGGVREGASAAPGAVAAGNSADARALARRLEGAEAALEAEREKMLTKLDRMASSIDWRLQRLEARDAGL